MGGAFHTNSYMYPTIAFANNTIETYTVLLMVAVLFSFVVLYRVSKRLTLEYAHYHWLWVSMLLAFGIGARIVGYVVFQEKSSVFQLRGETSVLGGILAILLIWFLVKMVLKMQLRFDALIPSILTLHVIGKLACLAGGCCYGVQTSLPWGIPSMMTLTVVAAPSIYLHPTQLYECFFFMLLLVGIWNNSVWRYVYDKPDGYVVMLYLCLYSIERWSIEFIRGDSSVWLWGMKQSQYLTMIVFACSVTVLSIYKMRRRSSIPQTEGLST